MDEIPALTKKEALVLAAAPETWKGVTPEQKDALLGLCYHAIDDQGSGFTSRHAKVILDIMTEMERAALKARRLAQTS